MALLYRAARPYRTSCTYRGDCSPVDTTSVDVDAAIGEIMSPTIVSVDTRATILEVRRTAESDNVES